MGKSTFGQDGQERLKRVLEYAGNDLSEVRQGIIHALRDVNEKGRRTYLWNQLKKRAVRIINARLKKKAQAPSPIEGMLSSDPIVVRDAFLHKEAMCKNTEEDQ